MMKSINPINRDRLAFVVCTLEIPCSNLSPEIGYRVSVCCPKDKGTDSPEIGYRVSVCCPKDKGTDSPEIGYRVSFCCPKDKGTDSPEIGPRTLPFDFLPV